jgi:hypothetical protein
VSVHPVANRASKNWKGSSILAIFSLIVAGLTTRYKHSFTSVSFSIRSIRDGQISVGRARGFRFAESSAHHRRIIRIEGQGSPHCSGPRFACFAVFIIHLISTERQAKLDADPLSICSINFD